MGRLILENHGYLTRERFRLPNGRLGHVEYTIHEQPKKPVTEAIPPKQENPVQVNSNQTFSVQASSVYEKAQQKSAPAKASKKKKEPEI